MNEPNSRTSKQRKRKSERLLNRLILGIVILVVGTAIVLINIDLSVEQEAMQSEHQDEQEVIESEELQEQTDLEELGEDSSPHASNQPIEEQTTSPGIVSKPEQDEDSIVIETIVDTSWEPIGTKQTGYHESKYDGKSIDWNEKKEAIAYATLFDVEDLIFWKIKNGGDEQRSIGIVSTFDKKHKYRVYLQWEDGKGWKPTKLEVLRTLDFEY